MISKKLLLSFFGISACFVASTVGGELDNRIVGGEKAHLNQFPYQVSLHYGYTGSFCGGGIIGDQFIITAGHCVVKHNGEFERSSINVIAGTNDLSNTKNAVNVKVAKIYVPWIYLPETNSSFGDIAVLKLEKPLGLSAREDLQKLELPNDSRETYVGEKVMIAGYGWNWVKLDNWDREFGGTTDTALRFAEADVLNNANCQPIYDAQICARTEQRYVDKPSGVCSGDSGGPLVHNGETVVGVVSTSPIGCTEDMSPATYTRVSSFLDFIDDAMHDRESIDIRTLELIRSSKSYDEPTEFQSDESWVWS